MNEIDKLTPEYKILKEEHTLTSEAKLKFCGYGEWVEEPDIVQFEYKGYSATVARVFLQEIFADHEAYFGGHLCGYVKIPEDHPYYGLEYDEIEIEAHGGVTFASMCADSTPGYWIGFDCGHSYDYIPTME